MAEPKADTYLRPGHTYPALPEGFAICDDPVAAGNYFLYRDRELIVHEDDLPWVRRLLPAMKIPEYSATPSPAGQPLILISFRGPVDTVDVLRRLRAAEIRDDPDSAASSDRGRGAKPRGQERPEEPGRNPPRVWFNHGLTLQSHVNYGKGPVPPRPRGPLPPLPTGLNLPGANVHVGILDTGIEAQDWFRGRWTPVPGTTEANVAELVGPGPRLSDQAGHGSFIAGTVLQHAPGAEVVVDRLEDSHGCISDWHLHHRLARLLDPVNQIDVLNLSFGGYTSDNLPIPGLGGMLTTALDANPDLVVVASAGNDGWDRPLWPASMPRVVGVGALDRDGRDRWPCSNHGAWVDAWTVGEHLSSTFVRSPRQWLLRRRDGQPGRRGPAALRLAQRFHGWAVWSGTSFAAARVSGAIAAELKRDGRTARRVVFDLVRNAPIQFESGGVVEPATFVR